MTEKVIHLITVHMAKVCFRFVTSFVLSIGNAGHTRGKF